MIAVLCPTRSRQDQYIRMLQSIESTVSSTIRIISASNDHLDGYVEQRFPQDCPTVHMWNKLAEAAHKKDSAKLFMLGADDIIFETPGWDKAIIDHYNALENKIHVYHLQDSRDVDGTPHPIVTREYMDAMGYFVPPIFLHWFVDSWTVKIAKTNNCFTHFRDFKLIHDKPNDKGREFADETHNHIRHMGWLSRDEYVNDKCQNFLKEEIRRLTTIIGNQRNQKYREAHS